MDVPVLSNPEIALRQVTGVGKMVFFRGVLVVYDFGWDFLFAVHNCLLKMCTI